MWVEIRYPFDTWRLIFDRIVLYTYCFFFHLFQFKTQKSIFTILKQQSGYSVTLIAVSVFSSRFVHFLYIKLNAACNWINDSMFFTLKSISPDRMLTNFVSVVTFHLFRPRAKHLVINWLNI